MATMMEEAAERTKVVLSTAQVLGAGSGYLCLGIATQATQGDRDVLLFSRIVLVEALEDGEGLGVAPQAIEGATQQQVAACIARPFRVMARWLAWAARSYCRTSIKVSAKFRHTMASFGVEGERLLVGGPMPRPAGPDRSKFTALLLPVGAGLGGVEGERLLDRRPMPRAGPTPKSLKALPLPSQELGSEGLRESACSIGGQRLSRPGQIAQGITLAVASSWDWWG